MYPLDLTAKLSHPTVRARIAEKREQQNPGPLVVELDPTSFCDMACPNCVTSDVLNDGHFSRNRLERLPPELGAAGVVGVILIGGGEPLLHAGVMELVEGLAANGIRIGIVTNGTQLFKLASGLVPVCDWIRVSVDAATPHTYRALRPHRLQRDVFGSVLSGLELASSLPNRVARIGYSFVVTPPSLLSPERGNLEEIYAAAQLAARLGCDYVEYKAEMAANHQVRYLTPAQRTVVAEQLRSATTVESSRFNVHLSSSMRAALRDESLTGQQKRYTNCPVSQFRTTLSPSGCYVCSYHRGNSRFSYGSLHNADFSSIWRERRISVDPSRDCNFHCARHETNMELGRLLTTETFQEDESSGGHSDPSDIFI